MTTIEPRHGAWGWQWCGPDVNTSVLNVAPPSWPAVDVAVRCIDSPDPVEMRWEATAARFALRGGGRVEIDANPPRVRLSLPGSIGLGGIAQPHLAAPAAALATWAGLGCLHAGGFVHQGRAWAVVGDKGAGKSSLLGQLLRAGCGILADDLVVWRDRAVLAGPRILDLRPEAAEALGMGRSIGVVGSRERWRVEAPDIESDALYAGFIDLEWGSELELRPLPLDQRLSVVLAHHPLPIATPTVAATLDLACGHGLTWVRPKSWVRSEDDVHWLLDRLPAT